MRKIEKSSNDMEQTISQRICKNIKEGSLKDKVEFLRPVTAFRNIGQLIKLFGPFNYSD